MLILQGILNLIFLMFAEKSKTHSDAFEDASYIPQSFQEFGNKRESTQCQRQCSQIVDENYPLFTIFTIFTIFSNKNQFGQILELLLFQVFS